MIASRIADSRAHLKAEGRRIAGALPYGYDADPVTKQLVVNRDESGIVRWMFELAAAGRRPLDIAEDANRRGWRTKTTVARRTEKQRGGNLWTARQVVAVLRNPVYCGLFRDGAGIRIGNHEPIIKGDLFDVVGRRLESRRTRTPGRRFEIDWPLKGRVRCAACGRAMSPHTVRHGNCIYRYYRCRSTAGGRPPCGHQVAAHDLELAVQRNLCLHGGAQVEMKQIRDHVESVTYDARDESIQARFILRKVQDPEAAEGGDLGSNKNGRA